MPLIQTGEFTLNSGLKSGFKIVADEFVRDNLAALTTLIRQMAGAYGSVYGVPRGGLALEESLLAHADPASSTVLIVDDVLTTGGSMRRAREKLAGTHRHVVGAVVFARGPCPHWVHPLFAMGQAFWLRPGR